MKKLRQISGLVLLFSVMTGGGFAQKSDFFGYYLLGKRSYVKVPFELHSNLIVVPIRINTTDTLRFILDTGVSTIIVTEPKAVAAQKLNFTRRVQLTGAGENTSPLEASVSIDNTIFMNYMRATHQSVVVLNEDVLKLSEFVGTPIHGIFGFELFNNFVVTIDFRTQELTLTLPSKYKYRPSKGDRYPITIENTKPYVNLIASVDKDQELPIKMLIDTGAGHALLLNQNAEPSISLPEKVIRAQLGRGLNGVINGSIGRLEKVRLGKYELQNVLASFPDTLAFASKLGSRNRHGNIGCELLRRFVVTFNYPEGYMALKPVKRLLKEQFEHDMSGLELRAKGDKFKKYYVDKIAAGSPAWAAGLQEGDELMFVNNKNVSELSISDIYKILQRGEGKEVTIMANRNNQIQLAHFFLKRMI